jgi:hypothetical protein
VGDDGWISCEDIDSWLLSAARTAIDAAVVDDCVENSANVDVWMLSKNSIELTFEVTVVNERIGGGVDAGRVFCVRIFEGINEIVGVGIESCWDIGGNITEIDALSAGDWMVADEIIVVLRVVLR